MSGASNAGERATCTIHYWVDAHGGPGFYYVDDEYPEEGSCGPFWLASEAEQHAREADYEPTLTREARRMAAQEPRR